MENIVHMNINSHNAIRFIELEIFPVQCNKIDNIFSSDILMLNIESLL